MSQVTFEAFVKSSQIWSAGVQDLSKQVAATAQAQMDETMSVFKAIAAVKSFKDMFELQSAFAKSALEKTMAESGKLTDASLKLTEHPLELTNVLRADEVRPSLDRAEVLSQAPAVASDRFLVPQIVGDEG